MTEDFYLFTLFWADGTREVIQGTSVFHAFKLAGYPKSSDRETLIFASAGDDKGYEWKNGWWQKKELIKLWLEQKENHND